MEQTLEPAAAVTGRSRGAVTNPRLGRVTGAGDQGLALCPPFLPLLCAHGLPRSAGDGGSRRPQDSIVPQWRLAEARRSLPRPGPARGAIQASPGPGPAHGAVRASLGSGPARGAVRASLGPTSSSPRTRPPVTKAQTRCGGWGRVLSPAAPWGRVGATAESGSARGGDAEGVLGAPRAL